MNEIRLCQNPDLPERDPAQAPRESPPLDDLRHRSFDDGIMIKYAEIKNFKCFKHAEMHHLGLINVIVGDNGAGKTALLEAIFLALGESPELILRYRNQRGYDTAFVADSSTIQDALVGDYFYQRNMNNDIRISLRGDGAEQRTVKVFKATGHEKEVPPNAPPNAVVFQWRDHKGVVRQGWPVFSGGDIQLFSTGENNLQFRYYPANGSPNQLELASNFSDLDRKKRSKPFVDRFKAQFPVINDLSVQVVAGATALHADVLGSSESIPVSYVSGAVNRLLAVFLGLAKEGGIVIVDEIDNGIYYKRLDSLCKMVVEFCRTNKAQIFMSTHNEEWLEALAKAAGDDVGDVTLIRVERHNNEPVIKQFSGKTFISGIKMGGELR